MKNIPVKLAASRLALPRSHFVNLRIFTGVSISRGISIKTGKFEQMDVH
jgi:hypothetical protein